MLSGSTFADNSAERDLMRIPRIELMRLGTIGHLLLPILVLTAFISQLIACCERSMKYCV
jgi:hypothetical protein